MTHDILDRFEPKCHQCAYFKVMFSFSGWDICGCRPLYPLGGLQPANRYGSRCRYFKWKY